jgi:hypothetical protein
VYDNRLKPVFVVYPQKGKPFSPEFDRQEGAYYKELDYFTDCVKKGKPFDRSALADVAPSLLLAFKENHLAGGTIAGN